MTIRALISLLALSLANPLVAAPYDEVLAACEAANLVAADPVGALKDQGWSEISPSEYADAALLLGDAFAVDEYKLPGKPSLTPQSREASQKTFLGNLKRPSTDKFRSVTLAKGDRSEVYYVNIRAENPIERVWCAAGSTSDLSGIAFYTEFTSFPPFPAFDPSRPAENDPVQRLHMTDPQGAVPKGTLVTRAYISVTDIPHAEMMLGDTLNAGSGLLVITRLSR